MNINDRITVHFYSNGKEFATRHADKVFTVYEKHGKLGINWNTENAAYMADGDPFTPFETFAPSVQFENIETGRIYYFDQIAKKFLEVYEEQTYDEWLEEYETEANRLLFEQLIEELEG